MMATLEAARDAFAGISGIASCKVGWEANISPASFPLIRVVPVRITPGKPYSNRTAEALLYFGSPIANSAGLENVYEGLFDLEADILTRLKTLQGRYIETICDEDRLDTYKLMAIRCELAGVDAPVRCGIVCTTVAIELSAAAAVVAPFTLLSLESEAADWTPDLNAGSITRELNGAGATRTRVTVTGSLTGPVDTTALLGIYADGVLQGNRIVVACTGAAVPFALQQTVNATAAATFDVRATGDEEEFTFAGVTMTAERY